MQWPAHAAAAAAIAPTAFAAATSPAAAFTLHSARPHSHCSTSQGEMYVCLSVCLVVHFTPCAVQSAPLFMHMHGVHVNSTHA